MPMIFDSNELARMVSLFLTISGEKSLLRSRGVSSSILPAPVFNNLVL
jgi:hypothetical protein